IEVAAQALGRLVTDARRADDDDAVGAQVQRRAHGCDLAHRAVAEELAIHLVGRKEERDRARGHEVLDADRRLDADALRALPALELLGRLEEAATLPRRVSRAGDGDRVERARLDVALDAREVEAPREQALERAVVEERRAPVLQERTEEESGE